ncbi:MAG: E2/UBC family protein [Coriobacteriia bacterium]
MPSGAHRVTIIGETLPSGWTRDDATILFIAPPGFPVAQPDCFWVEPSGLRLASGDTPQNTNDANPIPEVSRNFTWFSWHLQGWNPNHDSLMTYFNVIRQRLDPPR